MNQEPQVKVNLDTNEATIVMPAKAIEAHSTVENIESPAEPTPVTHGYTTGQLVENFGREGKVGYVESIDEQTGKAQIKMLDRNVAVARSKEATLDSVAAQFAANKEAYNKQYGTGEKAKASMLAGAAEIDESRPERLKKYTGVLDRVRSSKFGRAAVGAALGLGLAGSGAAVAVASEKAPTTITQEQGATDPGITPYKSQEAKDANTFPQSAVTKQENHEKAMFGEAERSWDVTGKISPDKVGAPMDMSSTDAAFKSMMDQARTNADVYAELLVGCDDELACPQLDSVAAKYDAASPQERADMYRKLETKLEGSGLNFTKLTNYGTTFTNVETKSVNWNDDRRTDGVEVLEVTPVHGDPFFVVGECTQIGFTNAQAEAKKLHELPQLPADQVNAQEETTETAQETTPTEGAPAPEETTPREDTPSEDTPTEEENPPTTDTPEEEEEEPEEETPEEELDDKNEDDNIYNHVDDQLQNGDDRFENSPETPDRSGEIPAERGDEPDRPSGDEQVAEGAAPVAPETAQQNEQIQTEQGTNTEIPDDRQEELDQQGAGELENGQGNDGRISE